MSSRSRREAKYNHDYYQEHRDGISQHKKDRYQNDPEYRAKMLKNAKKNRRKAGEAPDSMEPTIVYIGDIPVQAFPIGTVAYMVNSSVSRLKSWEYKGILPEPTIESSKRMYLPHQVKLIEELVKCADKQTGRDLGEDVLSKSKDIYNKWSG